MGDAVDNWHTGEHFHIVNGSAVSQGRAIMKGRGTPAVHDASPDVTAGQWAGLRTEAGKGFSAFDTAASAAWGDWWDNHQEQATIHKVMDASAV